MMRDNGFTFIIEVPYSYIPEREYIIGVLFSDLLGYSYSIRYHKHQYVKCSIAGSQHSIVWPDCLFSTSSEGWLTAGSLPQCPLAQWDYPGQTLPKDERISAPIPIIYGSIEPLIEIPSGSSYFPIDLLGSSFFMLSGYEEVAAPRVDKHGRFPASSSLASREAFLCRPIINEYAELFWSRCRMLWPGLIKAPSTGRVSVSCDVDFPRSPRSLRSALRTVGEDVIRRKSLAVATKRVASYAISAKLDPYDTFDWIMTTNERAGNDVTFFFLAGGTNPAYDADYDIHDDYIRLLMSEISQRGHEIGLHGSYNSYDDKEQILREFGNLSSAMCRSGVKQVSIGSRQHFLRWKTPITSRILDAANLQYDSTLGFAQQPGYRTGTCTQYRMFDLLNRSKLRIVQRPLVMMDVSIFGTEYLGLRLNAETLEKMVAYKKQTISFGGDFSLLWHNNYLSSPSEMEFYKELITC